MSSISLERYRVRHPSEVEAIDRIEALLKKGEKRYLTLDQFADLVSANSRDELALLLGELAGAGFIDLKLEVRSPKTRAPVRGFRSFSEIPRVLHDQTTDTDFVVSLDDVRAIYGMPSQA